MMAQAQAALYLQQHGATYVTMKDGVEWWRLPDGWWLAVRKLAHGLSDVRRVAPESCGC